MMSAWNQYLSDGSEETRAEYQRLRALWYEAEINELAGE